MRPLSPDEQFDALSQAHRHVHENPRPGGPRISDLVTALHHHGFAIVACDDDEADVIELPAPIEPSADIRSATNRLAQWRVGFREQGFTEEESFSLVAHMLVA